MEDWSLSSGLRITSEEVLDGCANVTAEMRLLFMVLAFAVERPKAVVVCRERLWPELEARIAYQEESLHSTHYIATANVKQRK